MRGPGNKAVNQYGVYMKRCDEQTIIYIGVFCEFESRFYTVPKHAVSFLFLAFSLVDLLILTNQSSVTSFFIIFILIAINPTSRHIYRNAAVH